VVGTMNIGLQMYRETSMRQDVTFTSGAADLRVWLNVPDSKAPWPIVVVAHGFSAPRHMTADKHA
jgi:hypothetical protein